MAFLASFLLQALGGELRKIKSGSSALLCVIPGSFLTSLVEFSRSVAGGGGGLKTHCQVWSKGGLERATVVQVEVFIMSLFSVSSRQILCTKLLLEHPSFTIP